jgi:hypothetical protein
VGRATRRVGRLVGWVVVAVTARPCQLGSDCSPGWQSRQGWQETKEDRHALGDYDLGVLPSREARGYLAFLKRRGADIMGLQCPFFFY